MKEWVSKQTGIKRQITDNGDGTMSVVASQDVEAQLDFNKAAYTHNDGYSPSRELKRAAIIPPIIAVKWLTEEGWWYMDPGAKDKLFAKLNSSEYLYLRTAPGHLASNRMI